jgi:hypothetical protein
MPKTKENKRYQLTILADGDDCKNPKAVDKHWITEDCYCSEIQGRNHSAA